MKIIKYLVLTFTILLIYTTTFAAEYDVPPKPASVDVADIDLDGDLDIILGHDPTGEGTWSGISLLNNNLGEFSISDTHYVPGYHDNIIFENINNNDMFDIITNYYDWNTQSHKIVIFRDYIESGYNDIYFINISNYAYKIISTNINSDNYRDLIFDSNNFKFWGLMYNDGTGQFSSPEYYYLDWYPSDISAGDLDGDGSDEIVVSLSNPALIYSYPFTSPPVVLDSTFLTSMVAIGDLDNDGDNDIVAVQITFLGTVMRIYENFGNLNFTVVFNETFDFAFGPFGPESFYDIDNNGYIDIICATGGGFRIFKHNGNFNFDPPEYIYIGEYCHASHFADLDNNGYKDLIKCYEYWTPPNFGKLKILFNDGTGNFVENPQTGIEPPYEPIPTVTLTNYPNPFSTKIGTTINFSLKKHGFVELKIYDIKGRLIKQIINQKMKGGEHNVIWNGKDENNQCCSSGIYLMNLKLNGVSKRTSKVILLK